MERISNNDEKFDFNKAGLSRVMEHLKPCPFCGSKKLLICFDAPYSPIDVKCADCCAIGPDMEDVKGAIEAWNRRAEPPKEDENE